MTPGEALMDELHFAYRSLSLNPPRGLDEDMLRVRLHGYRPKVAPGSERYACPRCFLLHAERRELRPISGSDEFDLFACSGCLSEFVIPFE